MTQNLDDAVEAYVWAPGSSIPGRHPERVPDPALRERVEAVMRRVDAVRPGADSAELFPWAEREARAIAAIEPELGERAVTALRDLISWTWR